MTDTTDDTPETPAGLVPRADLDAASARAAALEAEMADVVAAMLHDVPERLRGLLPDELSAAGKVKWLRDARALGVFATTVPATDHARPAVTPRNREVSTLPAHARIAAGYTAKR